jgi:hypothetical protein
MRLIPRRKVEPHKSPAGLPETKRSALQFY